MLEVILRLCKNSISNNKLNLLVCLYKYEYKDTYFIQWVKIHFFRFNPWKPHQSWLLFTFNISPSFMNTSLLCISKRSSSLVWYVPYPSPGISSWMEPWFLLVDKCSEIKGSMSLTAIEMSCFHSISGERARDYV